MTVAPENEVKRLISRALSFRRRRPGKPVKAASFQDLNDDLTESGATLTHVVLVLIVMAVLAGAAIVAL